MLPSLVFIACSVSASAPAPRSASATARASITILSPARIDAAAWKRQPAGRRREILVRDRSGARYAVRVVDFE